MTEGTDISIIIVNWNAGEFLLKCLRSIGETVKRHSYEVIVVDNASTDGSASMAKERFPGVVFVENSENVGFARGNNQAIRICSGRQILLLNPDTVLVEDALDRMADYMDEQHAVGAIGPRLLNTDETDQPSTAGSFPTLGVVFKEVSGLTRLFPSMKGLYLRGVTGGPLDVDWVSGACLLVRREAVQKVGMLNEGFFMYFEDQEWCGRIKENGYRVVFLPDSKVIHHGNKSVIQLEAGFFKNDVSYEEYLGNFNGRAAAVVAAKVYYLGLCLRWFKALLRHLVIRNTTTRERLAIMRHALRVGR